jgi:hypothetical protein
MGTSPGRCGHFLNAESRNFRRTFLMHSFLNGESGLYFGVCVVASSATCDGRAFAYIASPLSGPVHLDPSPTARLEPGGGVRAGARPRRHSARALDVEHTR